MPEDNDLTERLLKRREDITRMVTEALEKLHEVNERNRRAISPSHKRILEYFWNSKRKQIRDALPLAVVDFFESEESSATFRMLNVSNVNLLIAELIAKGYIDPPVRKPGQVRAEDILTLKRLGLDFLYKRHPYVFVWWTKILDALPSSVSLAMAAVGLVASVLGILQFFRP